MKKGLFSGKGKKHVLRNLNLTAYDGEILGIVGESGCGKSTLCKTILGLHKNYTGTMEIQQGIRPQMVFQDPFSSLNPAKTIGWILEEPLKLRGIRDKKKRKEMVISMLEAVGLDDSYVNRKAAELSGGQRQRISIGTALMMESKLIIADEPVSALDVTVQSQILNLLLKLHEERKMTMLFISHDLNVVKSICRRIMVIYKGEIVESGLAEDVYESPAHPYTKALLAAVADGNPDTEEAVLIDAKESVPAGFKGCGFYHRCPEHCDKCMNGKPEERNLNHGHTARCWKL